MSYIYSVGIAETRFDCCSGTIKVCYGRTDNKKLRHKQVPAFFYNSSLTEKEIDFTINLLCCTELNMTILFTSFECLMSTKLQKVLKTWNDAGKLSFILQSTKSTALIFGGLVSGQSI